MSRIIGILAIGRIGYLGWMEHLATWFGLKLMDTFGAGRCFGYIIVPYNWIWVREILEVLSFAGSATKSECVQRIVSGTSHCCSSCLCSLCSMATCCSNLTSQLLMCVVFLGIWLETDPHVIRSRFSEMVILNPTTIQGQLAKCDLIADPAMMQQWIKTFKTTYPPKWLDCCQTLLTPAHTLCRCAKIRSPTTLA